MRPNAGAPRQVRSSTTLGGYSVFPGPWDRRRANAIQFNERFLIPSAKDEAGTDLEEIRLY
jgi:hypothetical protein